MTSASRKLRSRKGIGGLRKRLRSGRRRVLRAAREPGQPSVDIVPPSTSRGIEFPNHVGLLGIYLLETEFIVEEPLLLQTVTNWRADCCLPGRSRVDLEALGSCLLTVGFRQKPRS